MTDYSQDFKKSAAKSFIESKYSPARFCVTFSNRNIDPMLLIEWVKDLAISVQANANYWHEQSNKQNVIINNLDAEIEGLHLKINQLAEHNAMLATSGIEKDKQIINCNLQLTQLFNENQSLMAEIEELKAMTGHRDNMQFIACCQKIVQDAEELQKHLEGGK